MPCEPNVRGTLRAESELWRLASELSASIFDGQLPMHAIKVRWACRLRTQPGRVKPGNGKGWLIVELNPRLVNDDRKLITVLVHQLCHAAVALLDHQPAGARKSRHKHWVNLAKQKRPDLAIDDIPRCHADYEYHYACHSAVEMQQPPCRIAYGSHSRLDKAALARYCCRLCALPLVAIDSLEVMPHDREVIYIQLARKPRTNPAHLGGTRFRIAADVVGASLLVGMASVDALWPAILPGVASKVRCDLAWLVVFSFFFFAFFFFFLQRWHPLAFLFALAVCHLG
jgi:predicted SprT family Zn-dependent metalloprotease